LRGGDQFQQFLGIIQPFFEFILVFPKRSGRELRCHAGIFQSRIRRDETHLIQAYALRARECGF
jgi:hypothetical protein